MSGRKNKVEGEEPMELDDEACSGARDKSGDAAKPKATLGKPGYTDNVQGRTGLRSGGDDPKKKEERVRQTGKPEIKCDGKLKQKGKTAGNEIETKKKKTTQPLSEHLEGHDTGGAYADHGLSHNEGNGTSSKAGYPKHNDGHDNHDQMQEHVFREAQASKQMVYDVYANCVTMLEEMETRELQKGGIKALPRSNIHLPDQSKFDDKTIKSKVDTQLMILQAQLTSCHDAIREDVKDELKAQTLHWASKREEKKLPKGMTDDYVTKLFGLLDTGKTDHPTKFYEQPSIDKKDMHKALGAYVEGDHKRAELDQAFRDDPNKKASGPNLRQTAGIDKGADRIAKNNPSYEKAVDQYRESIR